MLWLDQELNRAAGQTSCLVSHTLVNSAIFSLTSNLRPGFLPGKVGKVSSYNPPLPAWQTLLLSSQLF